MYTNLRLRQEATLRSCVEFSGVGVHSGKHSNMKIFPAKDGFGIVFKRTEVADNQFIELSPCAVKNPILCTQLSNSAGVSVSVIEHLMAAFRISGVTNALVEIDGAEVPIMDGSAKIFVNKFNKIGVISQRSFVSSLIIMEPIVVTNKNSKMSITPSNSSSIAVNLDYERINNVIGTNNSFSFNWSSDLNAIASSRTFGWLEDLDTLKSKGLGFGASADNTIAIMADGSTSPLRYKNEIVMHKCLDLIGDLSVLGFDLVGEIQATNPSHALNNMFAQKVMDSLADHHLITQNDRAWRYFAAAC